QYFDRFVITRPRLLNRKRRGPKQPGVTSAKSTLKTSIRKNVRLCNHSCQPHRVFQGEGVQGSAEADAVGSLRRRCEHCEWIRGNRELLKEMMIDDRVDVEPHLIRVLNLPHNLPGHVVVRLTRGCLHLAINSKTHAAPLRSRPQSEVPYARV